MVGQGLGSQQKAWGYGGTRVGITVEGLGLWWNKGWDQSRFGDVVGQGLGSQ